MACMPTFLAPTEPEKAGIVDRSRLYRIQGRSRAELVQVAKKYGIENPPQPSSGCALTSPQFSKKVKDIFKHHPNYQRWEFEILKVGRHFRLDSEAKLIVSKDERQNAYFESLHPEGTILLDCLNFSGPMAVLVGSRSSERIQKAASIMLRYAKKPLPETCEISVLENGIQESIVFNEPVSEAVLDRMRVV